MPIRKRVAIGSIWLKCFFSQHIMLAQRVVIFAEPAKKSNVYGSHVLGEGLCTGEPAIQTGSISIGPHLGHLDRGATCIMWRVLTFGGSGLIGCTALIWGRLPLRFRLPCGSSQNGGVPLGRATIEKSKWTGLGRIILIGAVQTM